MKRKRQNTLIRTSNTILTASDNARTVLASGTFSQTFDASVSLQNGWFVRYVNVGSGIITFDPNLSELIDGFTTEKLFAGQECTIYCNGIGLTTAGLAIDTDIVFTGNLDATKTFNFDADALITTANRRVLTVQDKNYTLAGLDDVGAATNKIVSITATQATGALTLGTNATTLDFRSTTLTSGVAVTRTLGAAATVVAPSGATLGAVSAVTTRLVTGLIDNAGTLEQFVVNLQGGANLDETLLISTTAISAGSVSANTFYSTTARSNVAFRITGFVDVVNTAGAWASPTLVQGIGGNAYKAIPSFGSISVNTSNGYGSTNNKIRRFINIITNQGTDITYADSATLGATFTINVTGVYGISYSEVANVSSDIGISLNSTQLTTSIITITASNVIKYATTPGVNLSACVADAVYLPAGSVIRAHTDGAAAGAGRINFFSITRLS